MNSELAEQVLEDQRGTGHRDSLPIHPRPNSTGPGSTGRSGAFRRGRFQRGHVPLRRALGPKNVLAVTMPYKTSSEATRRDSQAVIDRLGVCSLDVPITDQVDAYFARVPDASQLRLANKCARERMTVLYDQSAAFAALVAGTSNKSELLLGYGTQFGDMASAVNPIGDLYKTQLHQLAAHLGVPEGDSRQAADGRPLGRANRRGRIGIQLRGGRSPVGADGGPPLATGGVDRHGFAADLSTAWPTMIRRNHYKRRMPVIAKLSLRTMDRDFRYARDWGT